MSRLILDSEAVTRLARRDKLRAARLDSLKRRNLWPPVVPSVVLAECVSGRQSTDALVPNRHPPLRPNRPASNTDPRPAPCKKHGPAL